MLHALLAASEPSKLPWYIGGGVFVVWAVALGFLGLRNPAFPRGAGGERGVIGVSLVLAVVAIGCAVYAK